MFPALDDLLFEAKRTGTLWMVGGLFVTALLVRRYAPEDRRRLRAIVLFALVHIAVLPWAALERNEGSSRYDLLHPVVVLFSALAGIGMVLTVGFKVLLHKAGYRAPRILRDVVGALLMLVLAFSLASDFGVNLGSVIATSAVVTAVIGLALQDTLGNVIGGLMLQSDQSIEVGDWIKFNDVVGRVLDVRWRYTALETRNWETLIIPNGQMVKNPVLVLARRKGKPAYWRRLIEFQVDYRFSPTVVIQAVEEAVRDGRVPKVAPDPLPNCVFMGFMESTGRYILRYHLMDLAVDDPTDSEVRIRIYYALKRAGIPIAIPAQTVFTTDNQARRAADVRDDDEERRRVIDNIELFRTLPEEEHNFLAAGLRRAPFARGEVMTHQGADAHWLYLIVRGTVSVRVAVDQAHETEVNQLSTGNFFGELSLMTGEKRSATVVALTDVVCFRLDRTVFEVVIRRRPQLAEEVAGILAQRRMQLLAIRDNLDHVAQAERMHAETTDLAHRIREFFGLDEE